MTVIRHLSDLHSSFPEPKQDFDLTILSGDTFPDFLGYGNQHSAQQQEHWIKQHKAQLIDFGRGKPVYYVHGNHDFLNFDSPQRELGWIDLNNQYNEYYGILMYGFPYIPYICGRWNFELNEQPCDLQENEDFAKDNEQEVNECDDLCWGMELFRII